MTPINDPDAGRGVTPPPVILEGIAVKNYKAFADEARVDFAALTVVCGKNHAGKSALCRAPLFLTQPFRADALQPFVLQKGDLNFGRSLLDVCHQRSASGFSATLFVREGARRYHIALAVAEREDDRSTVIQALTIDDARRSLTVPALSTWEQVRPLLARHPKLLQLPAQIEIIRGLRARPQREYEDVSFIPPGIGAEGQFTAALLGLRDGADLPVLRSVNEWFIGLGVQLDVVRSADRLRIEVRSHGRAVNLVDAGEGIGQLLPVAVALLARPHLLDRGIAQPSLCVIEHPEEQLHPHAHADIADLLVKAALAPEAPRLLVETHSPVLLLRLRRRIAERRLRPEQVHLYFVEEGDAGSSVQRIGINDRGVLSADWPKGIFAEDHEEYLAIRAALAARSQEP